MLGGGSYVLIQQSSVGRSLLILHGAFAASSAEPGGDLRLGNYVCPPYMPHVFALCQYMSIMSLAKATVDSKA